MPEATRRPNDPIIRRRNSTREVYDSKRTMNHHQHPHHRHVIDGRRKMICAVVLCLMVSTAPISSLILSPLVVDITRRRRSTSTSKATIPLCHHRPHLSLSSSSSLYGSSLSASASGAASSSSSAAADQRAAKFHTDMHRVLESRENLACNMSIELSPMERRKRPALLTSDIDGAQRVASMLQHMVEIDVATEESFQIVMKALCQRGRLRWRKEGTADSSIVCAADEVGDLFDEIRTKQNGHVSKETCNLALQAYAACSTPRGNRNYAYRAEQIIEDMKQSGIPVTNESLDHVIHAWAWEQQNLKPGNCAERAQKYFEELVELEPDPETLMNGYHWLLEAWSKSSSEGSSEKAEMIFESMLRLRREHPDECKAYPNSQSYTNAILAWTKNHGQAEKANSMLLRTIQSYEDGEFPDGEEPELIAFNGVISAWARMGRADKAEEVLWMADALRLTCNEIEPDVVSFNSVLHAFVKRKGDKEALDRAISIVDYMEANDDYIKPDAFTYSMLLRAWLQSGRKDRAFHAEKQLMKMCDLWQKGDKSTLPSNHHFNIVINALAKSRNDACDPRKAYELLMKMQTFKGCEPDIISYTSVIECFAKSDDPIAAEMSMKLLQQATDIYEETGKDDIMPNLRTFTVAIQALSTKPIIDNVMRAREILAQMLDSFDETGDDDLRPNPYPYNYVLNCAANCIGTEKEKLQAFKVAALTYNEMRKSSHVQPDSYTYAFWFKACNNLLPEGEIREKGVVHGFNECKSDGLVSTETLRRLLGGTPPRLLSTMLDIKPGTSPAVYRKLTLEDFPPDWSRNVS